MSAITNFLVEEGLKFVLSQDSHVGCHNAESSQGNTILQVLHKKNLYTKVES